MLFKAILKFLNQRDPTGMYSTRLIVEEDDREDFVTIKDDGAMDVFDLAYWEQQTNRRALATSLSAAFDARRSKYETALLRKLQGIMGPRTTIVMGKEGGKIYVEASTYYETMAYLGRGITVRKAIQSLLTAVRA